jgi:polar amino acid transport system substrate-binding protein
MGVGFRKDETQLRDAFAAALKQVVADGTYAKLITKWKLDLSSYTEVTIDQGPAP